MDGWAWLYGQGIVQATVFPFSPPKTCLLLSCKLSKTSVLRLALLQGLMSVYQTGALK
jgi:hypothetical protein